MIDYEKLANAFIDRACDVDGVYETIQLLLMLGVEEVELENELHFAKEDIKRAKEYAEEDEDLDF